MSCQDVQEILPEVAGGEVSSAQAEAALAHVRTCGACATLFAELEATVALARKAGSAPLPAGFAQGLHQRLTQAGPPKVSWTMRLRRAIAERPLWTMFGSAATAAALAAILTYRLQPAVAPIQLAALPAPVEAQAIARVPKAKVALVKIDFVGERSVDDVQFEIMLPDGLRFFSRGAGAGRADVSLERPTRERLQPAADRGQGRAAGTLPGDRARRR